MLTLDAGVVYYLCGIMAVLGLITIVGALRHRR